MNIGIIGLGLIGASLAGAFNSKTSHAVFGYDLDEKTIKKALKLGFIDKVLDNDLLTECDIVVLALYPKDVVKFVLKNRDSFKRGAIVVDCAGVKRSVCEEIWANTKDNNFTFVGGHPMAGRQFSGIDYASPTLFNKASMILVPEENKECPKVLVELFEKIGCYITITTKEEHDAMIAYTSQLAHVVSNAYIKSPASKKHKGFSAGSYMDLTRVAYLNPDMWTELFLENADNLTKEIDFLIDNLVKINKAIKEGDADTIRQLLKEGADIKKRVDM